MKIEREMTREGKVKDEKESKSKGTVRGERKLGNGKEVPVK